MRGNRRLQLEDRLKQRKDVEDFIDIGDFQPLIAHHWDSIFRGEFHDDRSVQMSCGLLTSARNRVSHPGTQDIDTAEAKTYLYYIGEMLSRTNHPDEKRIVEELSKGIPDPEIAKLEASVGALAVKLNDTIQHLERLDNDADRDRAEIEGLKEQFRSQNQQLATEMVSRIESMTTPQEQPINSESVSDSPDKDELERLSSEVENTRRLIVALRSENQELRDKIEDVTELVVELQLNNAQEIADRVADDSNDEPEKIDEEREDDELEDMDKGDDGDEDDEDEEEDEGDAGEQSFWSDLLRAFRNSAAPRVWPGARYYCAQEDCNFTDGDWAGTRRAWWNQYKARMHANDTGHTIEKVRG